MTSANRLRHACAASAAVLLLAGCAPISVGSYRERGVDLSRYRTYDWAPAVDRATGDARLDNNPFFDTAVRRAVEKELGAAGFERTYSGRPELIVHYYASVSQELSLSGTDAAAYGVCRDCRLEIFDAGTLVIDVVAAADRTLLWRGWAKSDFSGAIDDQAWLEQRIAAAVTRIVRRLPAHGQ
jgi:hypothetical protein